MHRNWAILFRGGAIILVAVMVIFSAITRANRPDATEYRLLIDYWAIYVALSIPALAFFMIADRLDK